MTDLLDGAIAAHGGLDRINHFQSVSAHLIIGGRLLELKGQSRQDHPRLRVTVDLHREHAALWEERGETWRRLLVRFPPRIASHSAEQTFYFGEDGLLRRHDYVVEIAGNSRAAHYVSDHHDVAGIVVPTKRRVFFRQPDNTPGPVPVLISIDLSDIRFA